MTRTTLGLMVTGILGFLSAAPWGQSETCPCEATVCTSGASEDRLDLELLATHPLPSGVVIRGGALVGDEPVAWGPDAVILYGDAGQSQVVALDPPGELVGLGVDPESAELLGWDALAGEARRLTLDGVYLESTAASGVAEAGRAERLPDGWLIHQLEDGDSTSLFSIVPDHSAHPMHLAEDAFTVPDGSPPVRPLRLLGSDQRGAFVVEQLAPWRVWHVDLTTGTLQPKLLPGSEGLFDRADAADFPITSVVPLSILPLDRGHLYELAHLGGDERLVVLFDDEGCFLRLTPIDIALGFIASHPERRLLLAVRDTGVQELVVYRWQWSEVDSLHFQEGAKP